MSSPVNNNLPTIQPAPGLVNTGIKQQQRATHDPTGPSSSQFRHRASSNRNARNAPNRVPNIRQTVRKNPQDDSTQPPKTESSVENPDLGNPGRASPSQACADSRESGNAPRTINNRFKGQRPARVGGPGGGKYKQRQQMNQLIDGMDGLDIDLIESIAPTSSNSRSMSKVATTATTTMAAAGS